MSTREMTQARILVVDDQESNVQLLERLLRLKGYQRIESLTDSRLTVERFVATRPDLVLLDLRMPHLSGLEVLEELQPIVGAEEYLPILILTADTAPETRQTALSMGAKDFLNKPFDAVEDSAQAFLMIDSDTLKEVVKNRKVLPGIRLPTR